MKFLCRTLFVIAVLLFASAASADTLTLKNGDHLTGTVTDSDGKQITLKTDYAGDIKVQMSAIAGISAAKPLFVVTPDKKTVTGNVSVDGSDLVVHTESSGDVRVPLTGNTIVRSADAQQAYEKSLHPGLLQDWKGGVTAGLALARGNSDTTNFSTGLTGDRKTLSDEIKVYASSIYTTNGANTTGAAVGVTANAVLGGARYDRNITKTIFAFGSGDFDHDALQDLTLRQIYSGGLGWHVINTPTTTFDTFAGINYTRENYSSNAAAVPSVARNLPGLTVGEDFTRKIGTRNVFTEHFIFYPELSDISNYNFSLDSSLVTKINSWFGWQTSVSDRYVTDPPFAGTKSNDIILSTGVNITFSH
jgi:putative salt-induced outer membrane protein YdiY